MDAYRDAKKRLFADHLNGGIAVINVDDPEGEGMAAAADPRHTATSRVSVEGRLADIHVVFQQSTVKGIAANIATPRGEIALEAKPLIGQYNVANLALAVGICEALGIAHADIAAGIAALPGVPGRVERVANPVDLDIIVDYAHTPDALRNVLGAVRPLTRRRLICVFGCGGTAIDKRRRALPSRRRTRGRDSDNPAPRIRARSSIRSYRRCPSRSSSTSIAAQRSGPRSPRPRPATSS
jgi:UDP-N-acetylmuramyl tripeptide synthase